MNNNGKWVKNKKLHSNAGPPRRRTRAAMTINRYEATFGGSLALFLLFIYFNVKYGRFAINDFTKLLLFVSIHKYHQLLMYSASI